MTVTQVKDTLIVAALVCVVVAAHDIVRHFTYGSKASGWRPTQPLLVAPAPAAPIRR
jgi:hypothetical protein